MPNLFAQLSSPTISERSLRQAFLSVHFLIIGGGVAGLCSAITLARIGHRVTLLEASDTFDMTPKSTGTFLPPNAIKLLRRWGMEEQLFAMTCRTPHYLFARFDTGETLGEHRWNEEILRESGGDMRTVNFSALRKFLKDTAVQNGATIRTNARVASIEVPTGERRPIVTLESGEVFNDADIVIGADGADGITRKEVIGEDEPITYKGYDSYSVLIPGHRAAEDPELKKFLDNDDTILTFFGSRRSSFVFPIPPPPGSSQTYKDLVLRVFTPGDGISPHWQPVSSSELIEKMDVCDPRLRNLVSLSSVIARTPVAERPRLDDWVHENGKLLVIGDAAHLIFHNAANNVGLSVCDAATIGHLFQHLHHRRQIPSFLAAMAEIRQERIRFIRETEVANFFAGILADGPEQEARDAMMKARYKKGLNALDPDCDDKDLLARWESICVMYGYDAEEEADQWWAEWGSLGERATFHKINADFAVEVTEQEMVADVDTGADFEVL